MEDKSNKNKKTMFICFIIAAIIFYLGIVSYFFIAVVGVAFVDKLVIALIFQLIGTFLLIIPIINYILKKNIDMRFFIPTTLINTVYLIFLFITNFVIVTRINISFFILMHLIALFIVFLVTTPMYIMGKK